MKHCHYLLILLLALLTASCKDRTPVIETGPDKVALVKENMVNANRVVIQSENTQIQSYIDRHGWQMRQLPCSACYCQTAEGNGAPICTDDNVVVTYRLEALDGSPFYTHQVDTLVVGRRQVTVALDELLQQLRYGSKARLIAPSNAAYGVTGDGDRVPSRTVVIYIIENISKL